MHHYLLLIGNLLKLLVKSVSVPLGLTTATLATDVAIQNKIFGSGTANLIFSNEDFETQKYYKNAPKFNGVWNTIKFW